MNSQLASGSVQARAEEHYTPYTTNNSSRNDQICHPSKIERPRTPSPDSNFYYQTSQGRVPRSEMEPLDQMIYDLEVERLTKLELPHKKDDIVSAEFERRERLAKMDRNIHHFNWFGQAVYYASSTLAEQSLVVIMTNPKFASRAEDLWLFSILNRAYLYIDPVRVILNIPDCNVLPNHLLRGSNLEHVMKGHVVKYYTPHGLWMSDTRPRTEAIQIDHGNVANYVLNNGVGNGFIDQGYITSWKQWQTKYNIARVEAEALAKGPRKKRPGPSPLRQVMIAGAENSLSRPANHRNTNFRNIKANSSKTKRVRLESHTQPISDSHTVLNVQTISSSQPTLPILHKPNDIDWDLATNPDTYYSFPFPGPGRQEGMGIKGAFRKASKSAFSYLRCGSVDGVE